MPKLPVLTPKELVRILKKTGFEEIRQSGSHLQLIRKSDNCQTTVPMHHKDIGKGLLSAVLKQAKLTVGELIRLK